MRVGQLIVRRSLRNPVSDGNTIDRYRTECAPSYRRFAIRAQIRCRICLHGAMMSASLVSGLQALQV
jgi:hypothetical protein